MSYADNAVARAELIVAQESARVTLDMMNEVLDLDVRDQRERRQSDPPML